MNVIEFSPQKGIYSFELTEIQANFHAHPVVEILFSPKGHLQIESNEITLTGLYFAIIDRNISHKVVAIDDAFQLIMLACPIQFLFDCLHDRKLENHGGIYTLSANSAPFHWPIFSPTDQLPPLTNDSRVLQCIDYLNSSSSDYKEMLRALNQRTQLSESRLSHLFKKQIGISLKKYLVWCRLKKAFQLVLTTDINMYEAALQSGFYDQAHLSKAFKQMLGLSPSVVY